MSSSRIMPERVLIRKNISYGRCSMAVGKPTAKAYTVFQSGVFIFGIRTAAIYMGIIGFFFNLSLKDTSLKCSVCPHL